MEKMAQIHQIFIRLKQKETEAKKKYESQWNIKQKPTKVTYGFQRQPKFSNQASTQSNNSWSHYFFSFFFPPIFKIFTKVTNFW
jgi:hypothetical protein